MFVTASTRKDDWCFQAIINMEKNRTKPTYDIFCRIVHVLDVSANLFVYAGRTPLTVEQDQFIRELLTCTEHEQKAIFDAFRCFIRAMRHDEPEKQVWTGKRGGTLHRPFCYA